jgi:tetratricopeptide (TPR) repeat protein
LLNRSGVSALWSARDRRILGELPIDLADRRGGDVVLTSQVFVSHTSDMAAFPVGRSFVQAVLDGVGRAGMAAVDMRYFAAREGAPVDYCRQRVRECEIYVAVIGFRYGSPVPGTDLSYTEAEFQEATAAGMPRLVFLLDENARLPGGAADPDQTVVEGFRERLARSGLILARFASPADLELEVYHALTELAGTLPPATSGLGIRHSLPPDTAAFTGRNVELERITSAVGVASPGGGVVAPGGGVVSIHAIGGMPGAGKTALGVHAAHLLRERFPDWQLFIDLHAHTPGREPVAPLDALAALLTSTGIDPRFLPGDLDGRAALWRDQMAGQRALLVLDNAASSAQVTPLLPGGGDCLVLVTSRRHLGDLPGAVVPVSLDVLPAGHAAEMFTRLAPRSAADPAGVMDVVQLAGFLPLAVSLLARVFSRHPSWTLADLAGETRDSLLTVRAENDTIAAAFDVSYRHLDPALRRFFDLLGVHPGATIDSYAAAALADISPSQAGELLDTLHGEGLVTETGRRRFGMHDLLRRYARDHATAASVNSREALERLLDYYQHTAALARDALARRARPGLPPTTAAAPVVGPALDDAGQALAWIRSERDSLLAALDLATRTGQHDRVIALTGALAELLRRDGPWSDAIACHTAALQAARDLDDRLDQANTLNELGVVQRLTGDYPGATNVLEQALSIYRDLSDRLGQANTLNDLGALRRLTGDHLGAADVLEQALSIYRDLGDRQGEANVLNELGVGRRLSGDYRGAAQAQEQAGSIYRDLGDRLGQASTLNERAFLRRLISDYQGATHLLEQALVIYRDLDDQLGHANALFYLGAVRLLTDDYQIAAHVLEQALNIYCDLGDRLGQANTLNDLGAVRRLTGDYPGAAHVLEQALSIYRDLGNRLGEANALSYLGDVQRLAGDYQAAAQTQEQAGSIYLDLGNRLGQANTLLFLGAVRRLTGDYQAATQALEQALAIYRDVGDRGAEAEALNEAGTVYRVSGALAQAEECHQQALELARVIVSPKDEAHALVGLGRCAAAVGDATRAGTLLRQAHEIFQRIGAADAPAILAELGSLASQDPMARP